VQQSHNSAKILTYNYVGENPTNIHRPMNARVARSMPSQLCYIIFVMWKHHVCDISRYFPKCGNRVESTIVPSPIPYPTLKITWLLEATVARHGARAHTTHVMERAREARSVPRRTVRSHTATFMPASILPFVPPFFLLPFHPTFHHSSTHRGGGILWMCAYS
jgi:hypothetical protein